MHYSTELPLHGGKAPRWLFDRMVKLSRAIGLVIIDEFGADNFVERISNSCWFQAFACAVGYDWHSSGTTTVTVAALKEALNDTGDVYIAGGKGKSGLRTPEDIVTGTDKLSIPNSSEEFRECSRLAAKVDAGMVYDGIGIYQHSFIFTKNKKWAVIQQAMDYRRDKAIRFQWFSELVEKNDVANEPHSGIDSKLRTNTLDLTYSENKWVRDSSVEALEEYSRTISDSYPDRHRIIPQVDISKRGIEMIRRASEVEPKNYRELLLIRGVGRATLRSLAFISSLIYDKELAYRDPVAYAYNLGGKDRIPFEINRRTYDSVIEAMSHIVDKANIETQEKYHVLKRLNKYIEA